MSLFSIHIDTLTDQALSLFKNKINQSSSSLSIDECLNDLKINILSDINREFENNRVDHQESNEKILSDYQQSINQSILDLKLSRPIENHQISIQNMIISTLLSTIMVSGLIHFFLSYLFGLSDSTTRFISLLLGMAIALFLSLKLSQDREMKKMLKWVLGAAFSLEIASLLIKATSLSVFMGLLSSRLPQTSLFKRVFLYAIGFLFLKLSEKEKIFELDLYLVQLKSELQLALMQSHQKYLLDYTTHLSSALKQVESHKEQLVIQEQKNDIKQLKHHQDHYAEILYKVGELQNASSQQLPLLCIELLQIAKTQGVIGILDSRPLFESDTQSQNTDTLNDFIWDDGLSDRYDIFGSIKNGDLVYIEKNFVMVDGQVLDKGLVRKKRK